MRGKVPILVVLVLILGTGVLHGYISNRWGSSAPLQQAIDRLDRLPLLAGDWEGTIAQHDVEVATIRNSGAFVLGHYVNRRTGEALQVTLVCGRVGPLSLHPPTICFPAHGYEQKGAPAKVAVPVKQSGATTDFLSAEFARTTPTGEQRVSIMWCYGVDGQWIVPDNPRHSLASKQAVYKLYVARTGIGEQLRVEKDPRVAFLSVFMPELEKALSAP
jgi:hypothetical protein